MKEKELFASDYMTYYILHWVHNKSTVTTENMDMEIFAKKLYILEQLNLTYNTLHNNSKDTIINITARVYEKLKELRYIGEVYAKEHNMLTEKEFDNFNYVIQQALNSIRFRQKKVIELYRDKQLLKGYKDLKLTNSILNIILGGVEIVERICKNYLKEHNKVLPCEQVQDILEKGYMGILLEALDN